MMAFTRNSLPFVTRLKKQISIIMVKADINAITKVHLQVNSKPIIAQATVTENVHRLRNNGNDNDRK